MRARLVASIVLTGALVGTARGQGAILLRELRGDSPEDLFGVTLGGAGDVDGDGFADIVVGTHDNSAPHQNSARVFSGVTGSVILDRPEGPLFTGFGFAVSGPGDLDGDGFADMLVGRPLETATGGCVLTFSGRDGAMMLTLSVALPADEFGGAVSGAGDVDGDGLADFVVGSYYADVNGSSSGSARVFRGVDGVLLHTWHGAHAGDVFGGAVAGAGDVDLDGHADVLVSAINDDTTATNAGTVFLFSGASGALLGAWHGETAGDQFGRSLASIGDLDGDGRPEFVVGAAASDVNGPSSGSVYVFSPTSSVPWLTLRGPRPTAQLGYSVGALGDVDHDGVPDFTAGANLDDVGASTSDESGSAHAYSGFDGHEIAVVTGTSGERIGTAVAGAGDVNGDGTPDWLVGGSATTSADTRGIARLYSFAACTACFPTGLPYCFGHGADTPCPCGNATAPGSGQGCAHSLGTGGHLTASGMASVVSDGVVLRAELLPLTAAGVFVQGTVRAGGGEGVVFGDGLVCVAGSVLRLATKTASGGSSSFPEPGDPLVSVRGSVAPGNVRHYQLWFRNSASFCTAAVFNLTNAVTISWSL